MNVLLLLTLALLGLTLAVFGLLWVDWTPGRYKVIFHSGPTIDIKTKVSTGHLILADRQMTITGDQPLTLAMDSIRSAEPYRLHGLGQMIRVEHHQGTLFISVVRFCIAGQLALIDYFKTRKLTDELLAALGPKVKEG